MAGAVRNEPVFHVEEPQTAADTSNTDWASYRCFIKRLRRSFPPPVRAHWGTSFDIVLRSNSHQIKLRLSSISYGLIGYRMETPQRWLEFGEEPEVRGWSKPRGGNLERLIEGSSFLGMDSCYRFLEGDCMQTMDRIGLGQQQLTCAVNLLATSRCTRQELARSLIIVRLMICEGIRSSYFADYLAARFLDGSPAPQCMTKQLVYCIDRVRLQGQCIVPAGKNPDLESGLTENCSDKAPEEVSSDLNSSEDIARLIFDEENLDPSLNKNNLDQTPHHHLGEGSPEFGPCESASDIYPDDEPFLPDVQELAEVFFVRISSIQGKDSGCFYGTINISDLLESQCIYNRGPEESEFIHSGDLIALTGLSQPFQADKPFSFSFALMVENSWRPFGNYIEFGRHDEYDMPNWSEFYGEYCSVSVCYIALEYASYATLTVTFVGKDREDPVCLYGQLSASCGDFGYEMVLFQKKAEEHIDVCPGRPITLLRNAVSVPWDSRLVLRAELFECANTSFDGEIAKGVVEFPLNNKSGTFKEIIYHELGNICVKVVWK